MRNVADIPKYLCLMCKYNEYYLLFKLYLFYRNKDLLDQLLNILDIYNSTAISPGNLPPDPRSNPKLWNYTWTNFGDYFQI